MPTTLPYIPIADCISYAKICQYLIADDSANKKAFFGGFLSKNSPQLIYTVRKSLEWAYSRNPSDTRLINISNYLYSLIRGYIDSAKVILNAGGTGTIINPSTGVGSVIIFEDIQFIVGTVGSLMTAGQAVLTLTYNYPIRNSEMVIINGTPLQIGLTDTVSYTVSYTTSSIVVTFNQVVSNSQVITVKFSRYATI